jgi:hypothetical protein
MAEALIATVLVADGGTGHFAANAAPIPRRSPLLSEIGCKRCLIARDCRLWRRRCDMADSNVDLLDYCHGGPGHSRGRFTQSSFDGAEAIAPVAPTLRAKCLQLVKVARAGLTASEVATALDWDLCSVRPRFTELLRDGKIKDSGERRKARTRVGEIVWIATEGGEDD